MIKRWYFYSAEKRRDTEVVAYISGAFYTKRIFPASHKIFGEAISLIADRLDKEQEVDERQIHLVALNRI